MATVRRGGTCLARRRELADRELERRVLQGREPERREPVGRELERRGPGHRGLEGRELLELGRRQRVRSRGERSGHG